MNKTSIEWTTTILPNGTSRPGFSANPLKYRRKSDGKVVWACVKISPGCANCYAEATAMRFERGKLFTAANMEEVEPFLDEKELHKIMTAKTIDGIPVSGSKCFAFDMTDLFGEWVSDYMIDRVFSTFALRPDVTFQVLTKRAERLQQYMLGVTRYGTQFKAMGVDYKFPLPNLWCGVSVENQEQADKRMPFLISTPAAVRFVSYEPAIGPLDLSPWLLSDYDKYCRDDRFGVPKDARRDKVDWVIVGGESGHGARPCGVAWIRDMVNQCKNAGVACFVKQLGSEPRPSALPSDVTVRFIKSKKGGDMAEWPNDLQVREFPTKGLKHG